MFRLDRITTRGGDRGKTSLGDGTRVDKFAPRIALLGDLDEVNAQIGVARLHCGPDAGDLLRRVQNELFDLGGALCIPEPDRNAPDPLWLEVEIDRRTAVLKPLTSFVLPGGTEAAAHLHLARAVARRAERGFAQLAQHEPVPEGGLIWLNRLSDFLFVLARTEAEGFDITWTPSHRG